MRRSTLVVAFIGALVALLVGGWPERAAAQTTVIVSNVTELEAAVLAARGGGPANIRLRAGTYDLQSRVELSVAAGSTAVVQNFGDGPVVFTNFGSFRTGFTTGTGTYIFKGLTFAGSFQSITHDGGNLVVLDSTFTGNQLAIYTDSGDAHIAVVNSTFWENGATCLNFCGGIRLDSHASATITNSTFIGNGIGIYGLVSVDVVANTLLLKNRRDCLVQDTIVTFVKSLDGDGTCAATSSQATTYTLGLQSVTPGFGDHGGLVPTWLHTVLAPDPAPKAGDPGRCPLLDARGGVRNNACDIGALEVTHDFQMDATTGVGPVTFEVSAGFATGFRAIDPARVAPGNLPAGVTFPFGLFEWSVSNLSLGQSVDVTMTFPAAIAAPLQYWKGLLAIGPWTDLCLQTACTQPNPNQLRFTLVDGGVGDLDGVANGIIRDPGGLGVSTDVPVDPNLAITKAVRDGGALVSVLTVNNGATATYRLTVFNTASGSTRAPITVTDTLNTGLTFVSAGSDPRCSAAGQVVTCVSPGILAGGASDAFDVAVQVAGNAAPVGGVVSIPNTAVVATLHDTEPADNTSNVVMLTVVGGAPPNLRVQKRIMVGGTPSAGPVRVSQGEHVTYQLQVSNAGAGATAGAAVVTDTLDPRLSFVTAGSDARCSATGTVVTCAASGVIPAGGSDTFTLVTQVSGAITPTGSPIEVLNRATVSTPYDSDAGDDTSNSVTLNVVLGTATGVGTDITVQPVSDIGEPQPIAVTFASVSSPGFTTAIPSATGPALPADLRLGSSYYDIFSTARYTAPITVCVTGQFAGAPTLLQLDNGSWVTLPNQQALPVSGPPFTTSCATTSSLSSLVVGVANTPPALLLPAGITAEASSAAGAVVAFVATANDAEDGGLSVACSPVSGALFPLGVTTVTCGAIDANGANASGTFTVTVVDSTAPAIVVPANITQTTTSTSGLAVSFTVTANDSVSGGLTPSCVPASGSVFPIGPTTVRCAAQDAAGNVATAAFTVTVILSDGGPQAPTLTRMTPDSGRRGTYLIVLFQGTGLGRKPTVQFGEDVRVVEVLSFSPTVAGALVYIRPTAVRGPRDVTITNDAGTSNPLTFVVR